MYLELDPKSSIPIRASDLVDYATFRGRFYPAPGETELHMLEKFHAARLLLTEGLEESYLDPVFNIIPGKKGSLTADVCGIEEGNLMIVFCETTPPGEKLFNDLAVVNDAENARALILYPFRIDLEGLAARLSMPLESRKVIVEQLGWMERNLEDRFRDALEFIDLLSNATRVRMLLPLLEKPHGKKHYRSQINPKLVYENVASLLSHKIIDERPDDLYMLTPLGRQIFCEYLAFMERVRRMLDESGEA
jgi:hypothetical protein